MPSVTIQSQTLANDSGLDAHDFITDDGAVVLKGTSTGATSVTIYDNGEKLGPVKVGAYGNWAFSADLSEGYHTLYAMASDAKGKLSFSNIPQSIVVETQTPQIAVSWQKLTNDTGAADNVSTDGRIQLRGTVSEFYAGPLGTPGTLVNIYDGTKLLGAATVYTDNTWFYAGTLAVGTHSLRAVATDYAGNTSSVSAGPTVQIVPVGSSTGSSSSTYSGTVKTTKSDGSILAQTFVKGVLTQESVTFAAGSANRSETKSYTAGVLTSDAIVHADGSRDITTTNPAGSSFATQHATYDASGLLTAMTRTRSDNTLVSSYVSDPDGTKTSKTFDATNTLTSERVVQSNGSSETSLFAAGQLVTDALVFAPGATELSDTKQYKAGILSSEAIVNLDKSADHFVFNPGGHVVDHDVLSASGKLAVRDVTNADTSHAITIFDGGRTIASTPMLADNFTDAGPGGTTFVYAPSSGHDTIAGFHAGSGTSHDVMQIDKSLATNFANLSSKMSSSGTGTMITFDSNDSVLLKNVAITAVSSQNFSFG